jgi:hypothetical protein
LSLIGRFEQRLERGVEGFFARLFRSGVHPVEIGKRLLRVMEDGKTVALRRTYVPNTYRITVGPKDYERLAPLEAKLVEELEIFLGEAARQRDWALPDSPRVSFATDAGLSAGEFRVNAEAVNLSRRSREELPVGAEEYPPETVAPPPPPPRRREPERETEPCLVLMSDDQPIKTITIARRVKIGREPDNDLVVNDRSVSRHHAEITNERGTCTLRDLNSTNGTWINGTRVGEHALRDGDRISLGSTVVEFRRD